MYRLFFLLALVFPRTAFAFDVPDSLAEVRNGDVTISKFTCNRSYIAPEVACNQWKGRVAVTFDLDLLKQGFWRNYVHGEGTDSKFTSMGWKYELGIRLPLNLEFGLAHHSQHALDQPNARRVDYLGNHVDDKFPLEDSWFLRIQFAGKK